MTKGRAARKVSFVHFAKKFLERKRKEKLRKQKENKERKKGEGGR